MCATMISGPVARFWHRVVRMRAQWYPAPKLNRRRPSASPNNHSMYIELYLLPKLYGGGAVVGHSAMPLGWQLRQLPLPRATLARSDREVWRVRNTPERESAPESEFISRSLAHRSSYGTDAVVAMLLTAGSPCTTACAFTWQRERPEEERSCTVVRQMRCSRRTEYAQTI